MDTKTPPILLKHHQGKKFQSKRLDRVITTSDDITLPPLSPLSHETVHSKVKHSSTQWTHSASNIYKNQDYFKKHPYRILHIGATPLMHASQQGDRSRVLRLLREQENTIGYRDRTLRSALHYCMDAATGGAVASAAPELVNAPDAEGHTPLHLAVIAGDTQLVAVLLANGADVNSKDLEGHSVLHWATVCGEVECVRLVLAAGARPSTPDHRGGSPLHYAAQCCGAAVTTELSVPKKIGFKVLQTLLEFDADVNAKDEDGRQPILWAASAGSVEAVIALARTGGAAAAGATDKDGLTALHCAASRGHTRCVEELVNLCGAQPDHVDDNGCSALHYASTLGHADATALLLRLGADPNRQDRKGRTPALCAAAKGQLETLKILAQHGGSLHARTVRGTGVVHEAVLSGRIELIEWLVKKKPTTVDVATHDGKTPLHVAALYGYLDACKILLDHTTCINSIFKTSKSGPMTPLDAALYRGHRDCAKLIQMHGGTTAHNLRTHQTAPKKVFAAKLKVKHRTSSSGSESFTSDRDRRGPRVYIEKHWIEKRTCKCSSPRKHEERRGSRSFSEEEVRLSKLLRLDRRRRARSESARYEDSEPERNDRKHSCGKRHSKHEYSELSSELDDTSSEELVKCGIQKCNIKRNVNQNGDEDSISDDSLEVVMVQKSSEKILEKVQYSGRKSNTPQEAASKEIKLTETKQRSSRKKTKIRKSYSDVSTGTAAKTKLQEYKNESPIRKKATTAKSQDVQEEQNSRHSHLKNDATDSTSQEIGKTVVVTALVHKDQAPDSPPLTTMSKNDRRQSKTKIIKEEIANTDIHHVLEKADKMHSVLMVKAVDFEKNANEIRQMTEKISLVENASDVTEVNIVKNTSISGNDVESKSETTAEDTLLQFSQSKNQSIYETNDNQKSIGIPNKVKNKSSSHGKSEGVKDDSSSTVSTDKNKLSISSKETYTSDSDTTDEASCKKPGEPQKNTDDRELSISTEINQTSNDNVKNDINEENSTSKSSAAPVKSASTETKDVEEITLKTLQNAIEEEKTFDSVPEKNENDKSDKIPESVKSDNLRHIDSSSSSAKSDKRQQHSKPSTDKIKRNDDVKTKSSSKHNLYERSGEQSPDRSAIVAVIDSPEWDEEDEEVAKEIRDAVGDSGEQNSEPENDDSFRVLRVLPSTSEDETPPKSKHLLQLPKKDKLPRVEHPIITSPRGPYVHTKQRRDSGGRDSGIEPSPRVSKIPKRMFKCSPNTKKHEALNMETVTRDVQISLRRYHLERKIFFQLMELKRLQIRHGRANEQVLVKRQVDVFHKAGMTGPTLGVAKYDQPYTFKHFETFLYEQLRRLQKCPATPEWCTDPKHCTQKTHRCHHATNAYTSMPIYNYLGGECQDRDEGTLLPRIENRGKGQMTVEVNRRDERQVIALPTEKLDRTKRYFVTFTVRGETQDNQMIKTPHNAQRNTKSV